VLFLVHRSLSPWWRRRQVPPKRRFLQEPHGVTTQKTPFFIENTTFRKVDLFPPSRDGRRIPTLLGPLERANLYHGQIQFPKRCFLVFRISEDEQKPSNSELHFGRVLLMAITSYLTELHKFLTHSSINILPPQRPEDSQEHANGPFEKSIETVHNFTSHLFQIHFIIIFLPTPELPHLTLLFNLHTRIMH
jgi:hypothetical protein